MGSCVLGLVATGCVHHSYPATGRHASAYPQSVSVDLTVHPHRDVTLVFDRSLDCHVVVGRAHHYFYRDRYYRLHDGRWQVGSQIRGPWALVNVRDLPPRLWRRHAPQLAHAQARQQRQTLTLLKQRRAQQLHLARVRRAAEQRLAKERRASERRLAQERLKNERKLARLKREAEQQLAKEQRAAKRRGAKERRKQRRGLAEDDREEKQTLAKERRAAERRRAKDQGKTPRRRLASAIR